MTIYEKIKELSEEGMAEFLTVFAQETIEQFSNFFLPKKEHIREFLSREKEESFHEQTDDNRKPDA